MSGGWVGTTFAVHQLRAAVLALLQDWLPAALVDVARQTDVDPTTVPQPRSWRRIASWSDVPEDQLPVVFVASPSTADITLRRAESWSASWDLQVMMMVRGNSYEQTAERVSVYEAAARAVLLQRPLALDQVTTVRWLESQYDAQPTVSQRTLAAALLTFRVDVEDVAAALSSQSEATEPPADPYDTPSGLPTVVDAAVWINEEPT